MNESQRPSDSLKVFDIVVLIAVIAIVAAALMPNFIRDGRTSPKNKCINNLRLIDGAKWTWALDHDKSNSDVPTWADIVPYLDGHSGNTNILKCPLGGTYTLGAVTSPPTCSIPGHALP